MRRRDLEVSGVGLRPVWIALSLAAVLALQLWACWGKLGLPFLDTRLHYGYDNADFSFRARSGNRNGDLRSQFGVTVNTYSRWGERAGKPAYSTDHPFLVKTLFQQYTKIVGTQEWASRSFYLAVAFLIAAGLYTVLLQTTGSLLASLAGAATLVSLPLFAVYQTSVKFETDGMLVSVWLFAALAAYLRHGTRRSLALYGILTGLAFLVHWTAILFVGVFGAYLLLVSWRSRDPRAKRALVVTVTAALLGIGALIACLSYVQGGPGAALGALESSFARRSASIPIETWWARQWVYAKKNFSEEIPWLILGLLLLLAGRWMWSRFARPKSPTAAPQEGRLLALFFVATLTVACVWQLAFPQGSFVHVYWQYWFCLPIATLVAAVIASLRTHRLALAVGSLAGAALVISLLAASRASYAGVFEDQLGKDEDIAFLRSLREDRFDRLVFVPLTDTPLNQWFQGPLFEYYTDRVVGIATRPSDLRPAEKVLVLRYRQRDDVVARLAGWSGKRLANEKCGLRICAYDVLEP